MTTEQKEKAEVVTENVTLADGKIEISGNTVRENEKKFEADGVEKDLAALFRIGYGLYVVTAKEHGRDNGLIVNAVMQVTNSPDQVALAIHKESLTHEMICHTGRMNVICLSEDAPYGIIERFGMKSGKTVSKFEGMERIRAANGVVLLPDHVSAWFSLALEQMVDLGTHTLFIGTVTEARVVNDAPAMTYNYYREHVKPKSQTTGVSGFVCRVCGYVYEGDTLPADLICPVCLHGAEDFEPIPS